MMRILRMMKKIIETGGKRRGLMSDYRLNIFLIYFFIKKQYK
jgi:hypothetical protein